ncbi:MAG TPA: hypothetical protein VGN52_12725 [Burkholderiales bacterium]|jgi:hypothetical protein
MTQPKVRDEFDITIVNYAREQATHADLVLAEEEYARKKALALARRDGTPAAKSGTSAAARRVDQQENVRQMKRRLADPGLSLAERNLLQKKLADEEMVAAFTAR